MTPIPGIGIALEKLWPLSAFLVCLRQRLCLAAGFLEADGNAVFAHFAEDGEQVGDAEELADARGEIDELQFAAGGFGGDVEARDRADAHRVHVGEISEVEDDVLVVGDEALDVVGEYVGDAGDELAAAVDDHLVGFAFVLQLEEAVGGGLRRHGSSMAQRSGRVIRGRDDCRTGLSVVDSEELTAERDQW